MLQVGCHDQYSQVAEMGSQLLAQKSGNMWCLQGLEDTVQLILHFKGALWTSQEKSPD